MKTFEERYTAWLDDGLTGDDLTAFERELAEHGETLDAKKDTALFQTFFRVHLPTPALESPDFFNHSLMEKLKAADKKPAARPGWSFPRLAWFGGLSLATALVLFVAIIPKKSETHSQSAYIAQVISARSADPNISATAFQTDAAQPDDMTVVWLDGLDYVPENAQ
ncbi:MAG: hypothetical protein ABIT76_09300 [Chthoniobacterales bacterium]